MAHFPSLVVSPEDSPLTDAELAKQTGMSVEEIEVMRCQQMAKEDGKKALSTTISDPIFSYGLCMQIALHDRVLKEEHKPVETPPLPADKSDALMEENSDEDDGEVIGKSGEYEEVGFETLGIDPSEPTKAKPGTEEKILILAARVEAGLRLWHSDDCNDHGPGASVARLTRK